MPTAQPNRTRQGNSDFIRVKKNFFYGLLIAVAALFLLCLILMITTSSANKKVKKYNAAYGPLPQAADETDPADSTTLPDASVTDAAGVSGAYTTLPGVSEVTPTLAPAATTGTAYIVTTNADTLNLRSAANENASVLARIPKNTIVYVTEQTADGWGKTNYNGTEGYVKMAFLTATASTTAATVAP